MRARFLPLFLCFGLIAGCETLGDLELSDIGIGGDSVDSEIEAGAKDFVSCNLGRECDSLWQQARLWLDNNAPFKVKPKNEVTLTAFSPEPDQHREKFQYRITLIAHQGGTATIKVEAFCADLEACEDTAVKQVHDINEYLRNHLRGIKEGLIPLEGYEEPELAGASADAEENAKDELSDMSLGKEYRRGQYYNVAQDSLVGEGCLKQSKMELLKSDGREDLYEVRCLTGIRRVVFRCTADGCSVLE